MVIAWIVGLTAPLFSLFGHAFSWRDLILIGGGLFLIGKATHEIHQKLEGAPETVHAAASATRAATATFGAVIAQIMLLEIVFSLDSLITADGMHAERWVMESGRESWRERACQNVYTTGVGVAIKKKK